MPAPNPSQANPGRLLKCDQCGLIFFRRRSRGLRHFCSPQCARLFLSQEQKACTPVDRTKPFEAHTDEHRDTWGPYRTPRTVTGGWK